MTRRAPLIALACALLLAVAFWYLLYRPRSTEQARYHEETAEIEGQRSQLQTRIASLREVEQNAGDYRSRLERLAELIPDHPAQPAALRELQRVSDESGVEITETLFADPEPVVGAPETGDAETILAQIAIQMTAEGGYFQVVDLLRRIEVDLARVIKVDSVAMAEAEDGLPRLAVTWTGQIFAVLPITDVVGEEGLPIPPTSSETPSEGATQGTTSPDQPTQGPGAAPADGAAPDGTTATS